MMKQTKHTILLLLLCLFAARYSAQNLTVTGGTTLTVNTGTKVVVLGNVNIDASANIDNAGTIELTGDWTNDGNGLINGSAGTVEFTGTSNQDITGTTPTEFYNLTIDNSSGVTLGVDATASNNLNMTDGNIDAGSNTLELGISTSTVGSLTYTTGNILGNFKRWINSTGTGILYPVGTASNNHLAVLTFSDLTNGSVTGSFTSGDPGSAGLPVAEDAYNIGAQFTEGYWTLDAGDGLASTGYDLDLDGTNFSSYTLSTDTRVLKRPNAGNWSLDGSHVAGSPPTASRSGLSGFSQFALGDAVPCLSDVSAPSPSSQVACYNISPSSLSVTPTGGVNSKTYQWYYNTVDDNTTGTSLGAANGAQTDTYSPPSSNISGDTYYYCVVQESGTACEITSATALVTVADCPNNDSPAQAQALSLNIYTGLCNPVTGTLVGAVNSAESMASVVTGEDVWYSFTTTALQTAARITVTSSTANILIELQQTIGTTLDAEDVLSTVGGEILNYSGLTPNTTYYVSVTNYDSGQGTGTFSLCVSPISASSCVLAASYNMCTIFKGAYMSGSTSYKFEFSSDNFATIYSKTQASNLLPLYSVLNGAGVNHFNKTYKVRITTFYTLTNAVGNEVVQVPMADPCEISLGAAPVTELRLADQCVSGPRRIYDTVRCGYQCAATDYKWQFEELLGGITPSGLTITRFRGTASNLIQLSSVPQLQLGKTYRVRVGPVYGGIAGGGYASPYDAWKNLCILGVANALESEGESVLENPAVKVGTATPSVGVALYPNPNNGEMVTLNVAGIDTENLQVRILDGMGRMIWRNRFVVDNSLTTIVTFDKPLAGGLYTVEFTYNGTVETRRMMVQR